MYERQAYVEKIKSKLDESNADIHELEAQATSAEADAQIRLQQQLDQLKATRDEAAKRQRKLQHASDGDW